MKVVFSFKKGIVLMYLRKEQEMFTILKSKYIRCLSGIFVFIFISFITYSSYASVCFLPTGNCGNEYEKLDTSSDLPTWGDENDEYDEVIENETSCPNTNPQCADADHVECTEECTVKRDCKDEYINKAICEKQTGNDCSDSDNDGCYSQQVNTDNCDEDSGYYDKCPDGFNCDKNDYDCYKISDKLEINVKFLCNGDECTKDFFEDTVKGGSIRLYEYKYSKVTIGETLNTSQHIDVEDYLDCENTADGCPTEEMYSPDIQLTDDHLQKGITYQYDWPYYHQYYEVDFEDTQYRSCWFNCNGKCELCPRSQHQVTIYAIPFGEYREKLKVFAQGNFKNKYSLGFKSFYIKDITGQDKKKEINVIFHYGDTEENHYIEIEGAQNTCINEPSCTASDHVTCKTDENNGCSTLEKNCGKRYVDKKPCEDRTIDADCEQDKDGCYLPKCNGEGYSKCPDGQICEFKDDGCQYPIEDAGSSENFQIKFNFLCNGKKCTKDFLTDKVQGGVISKLTELYRNLSIDDIPNTKKDLYLYRYVKCPNSPSISSCSINFKLDRIDITKDDKYLTEGITFNHAWPSDDQMVEFRFSDNHRSFDLNIIPYEGKLIIVLSRSYYIKNLTPKNNTLELTWHYGENVEDNYIEMDDVCLVKKCISSSHVTCKYSQYSCATVDKNCGKRYVDETQCEIRALDVDCEQGEDGCYLPKCNGEGYSKCPDGQICEFKEGCQIPKEDTGTSENFHIKFNFLCDGTTCTKDFLTDIVPGGYIQEYTRLYRNLSIDDIPNTKKYLNLYKYFQCHLSTASDTFNGCLNTSKSARENITEDNTTYLDEGITFTHAWPSDDQMLHLEYLDLKFDECWKNCGEKCEERCPAVELYSDLYIIPYEGKLIIVQNIDSDYKYIKILTPKNNTLEVTWNYSTKKDNFYVEFE